MNRILRKAIIISAAAAVFVGICGCEKKQSESEITNVKWYAYGPQNPDDKKVFDEVNKYTEEKIGVHVDYTVIAASEYNEKMKMLLASNDDFDMCFQSSTTNFYTNVRNGVFMPLDELLDTVGKPTKDLTPDYFFDAATVNNKIYAIPMNKDVAEQWGFAGNAEMAERNNIDVSNVRELKDLEPIFQTIKDNEPNVYPCLIRGNNNFFRFLPFDAINGCSVGAFRTDSFDKVINQYDTDEAREYFKLMRSWYQKGFFRSDAATATNDSDIRAAGNWFACYIGYLPYNDYVPEGQKAEYVYMLNINEPHVRTGNVMGSSFAISSNSKNPEKTMEFINLLNTDVYLRNLVALGIEGEHWIAVGDNKYKLPDGMENRADTGYTTYEYTNGNRFILRILENKPDDMWEKFKEFNENSYKYPNLGFVFNPEKVMTEITAIENVYQEYIPSLSVGAIDPDEHLPKFLEKLNNVGVQTVLDEMQRQYDEWKANNR